MKILIEIIGWSAAAMMLAAYFLLTSGRLSWAIRGGEIWSLLPRSVQDEQLMLEQERLGDDRTETAWSGHLDDRDNQMSHED